MGAVLEDALYAGAQLRHAADRQLRPRDDAAPRRPSGARGVMSGIPAATGEPDDVAAETAARAKALDDAKLQQIVSLLEAALERPDGVTAKTMLDQLRPKLVEARPPRRPHLRRSLCEPFEDMLVNGVTSGHLVGRIPRSAIMPVWDLFAERGDQKIIGPALSDPLDKAATAAAL